MNSVVFVFISFKKTNGTFAWEKNTFHLLAVQIETATRLHMMSKFSILLAFFGFPFCDDFIVAKRASWCIRECSTIPLSI